MVNYCPYIYLLFIVHIGLSQVLFYPTDMGRSVTNTNAYPVADVQLQAGFDVCGTNTIDCFLGISWKLRESDIFVKGKVVPNVGFYNIFENQ